MCNYTIATIRDGIRTTYTIMCSGGENCLRKAVFADGIKKVAGVAEIPNGDAFVDISDCEKDANPVEKGLTN